jgi:hypothetical protein
MTTNETAVRAITLEWSVLPNEHGGQMLWLGSWLVGDDGSEGTWFYSGRGGQVVDVAPPPGATGMRIRRWPSDGLTPEYVDLDLAHASIRTADLDFDRRQRFARLSLATIAGP